MNRIAFLISLLSPLAFWKKKPSSAPRRYPINPWFWSDGTHRKAPDNEFWVMQNGKWWLHKSDTTTQEEYWTDSLKDSLDYIELTILRDKFQRLKMVENDH